MRADKKNHWIHLYASGDITLKKLHQKSGKKVTKAINIVPRYGGRLFMTAGRPIFLTWILGIGFATNPKCLQKATAAMQNHYDTKQKALPDIPEKPS